MSELFRWFPMSMQQQSRGYGDDDDFGGFAQNMDRQMRTMQRDMDRMFAHVNRMNPQMAIERGGASSDSPLNAREAEDALALNPVKKDKDGKEKMEMNFDLRAYKPEEITVKTKDGKFIEVQAKHEEETDNGKILRHYHRVFTIPEGTDVQHMHSMLSPNGVLNVTAPIKSDQEAIEAPKEKKIAISHE